MTADVVQLAPAGRSRHWPVLIPRALFTRYQSMVGARATLLWINLYEMAEGGVTDEFVSVESVLTARTGFRTDEVESAARGLERAGLLHRSGGRWTVLWPADDNAPAGESAPTLAAATPQSKSRLAPIVGEAAAASDTGALPADGRPPSPASAPVPVKANPPEDVLADGQAADPADGAPPAGWNSDEAALQAVVQFYHQRIGMLGPSQFEKLRFWVEEQGMSSDVVALAIEETVQSAPTPRLAYVEGVLRNWYNAGIRTVADLQKSKKVRSQEVPPSTEGTANAAAFEAVDRDAVRRWKELYADEYDD